MGLRKIILSLAALTSFSCGSVEEIIPLEFTNQKGSQYSIPLIKEGENL